MTILNREGVEVRLRAAVERYDSELDERVELCAPALCPHNNNLYVVYLDAIIRPKCYHTESAGFEYREIANSSDERLDVMVLARIMNAQERLLRKVDGNFVYDVKRALESV